MDFSECDKEFMEVLVLGGSRLDFAFDQRDNDRIVWAPRTN